MSVDPRDTVDVSSSSNSSCSTGELLEALNGAEAAQAEAFGRSSGTDAIAIREAMTATKTLKSQIQQLQGTQDLTIAFNRELYAVRRQCRDGSQRFSHSSLVHSSPRDQL